MLRDQPLCLLIDIDIESIFQKCYTDVLKSFIIEEFRGMYFHINPILFISKNHSISPSIFYFPIS